MLSVRELLCHGELFACEMNGNDGEKVIFEHVLVHGWILQRWSGSMVVTDVDHFAH